MWEVGSRFPWKEGVPRRGRKPPIRRERKEGTGERPEGAPPPIPRKGEGRPDLGREQRRGWKGESGGPRARRFLGIVREGKRGRKGKQRRGEKEQEQGKGSGRQPGKGWEGERSAATWPAAFFDSTEGLEQGVKPGFP